MSAENSSAVPIDPCEGLPTFPTTHAMLNNMDTADYVLLPVCCVMSSITLAVFIWELILTNKYFKEFESRRRKTLVVLALYPVFSLTSLTALWVPGSAVMIELVASSYLSYTVYTCLHLVADYYGGRDQMIKTLSGRVMTRHPKSILCSNRKGPAVFSEKYFRLTKFFVLQFAVLRPLLGYVIAIMWTNGSYIPGSSGPENPAFYISVVIFISIVINLYGMVIFMGLATANLPEYHLKPKYLGVQLTLLSSFFVSIIIGLVAGQGAITCQPPFSVEAHSSRLNHIIMIMEMLLLSGLGRYGFLRKIEYSNKTDEEKPKMEHGLRELNRENSQTVLVQSENGISSFPSEETYDTMAPSQ